MPTTTARSPFYLKFSLSLLALFLLGALVYIGKDILLPLFFAIVLAILLLPVSNFFERKGVPRVLAMLLSILLALLFIGGIIYFLSAQVAGFMDDLPQIKEHLSKHISTVKEWISTQFKVSGKQQEQAVEEMSGNMKGSGSGMLGGALFSAVQGLVLLFLLPIYTFLIMYYRDLIRRFFIDSFPERHHDKVQEVISESRQIVQGYMVGLLLELAIVTGLNAAGFLVLGIEYAIFLAVLAAILNMIPYVGMLVATVICMGITLTTSTDIADLIWVGAILIVVQFIDNNFIMPYVVSSKVKINALVSIVGVLVGGALAGVGGMFLSIPGVAILKSIFERIDDLKPWGMLMGDAKDGQEKKPRTRRSRSKDAAPGNKP